LIDKPGGRPVADQVYEAVPPEARTVRSVIGTPVTSPWLLNEETITPVVIMNAAVPNALAVSVAFTVTLDVPVPVGVPDMTPVLVLIDNPAGRPVADPERVKGMRPTGVKRLGVRAGFAGRAG
jgi:hypothetical protein